MRPSLHSPLELALVAEKRYMSEGSMALLAPTASAPELEVTLATT